MLMNLSPQPTTTVPHCEFNWGEDEKRGISVYLAINCHMLMVSHKMPNIIRYYIALLLRLLSLIGSGGR